MKKFFRFGKDKKDKLPEASSQGRGSSKSLTSNQPSTSDTRCGGYEFKEKDAGKLHKAVWNGDLHKVKQLAKKDSSPLDKEHRTPLHLACAKGHHLIVQELLEWKAKVNVGDSDAKTPLMKAVECDHEECARIMLEDKADPNVKDKVGQASLHYAVKNGSNNIILHLLALDKTDIGIKTKKGNTPLHISVLANKLSTCKLLLDEGADPDIQNMDGKTPLMMAADNGLADFVKVLLDNQADTTLKDKNGWTADDIAVMQSQDACQELLQQASGADATPRTHETGAIGGGALGVPALDQGDDYSDLENTEGAEGEGEGLDSWADSDPEDLSESELRKQAEIRQKREEQLVLYAHYKKKSQKRKSIKTPTKSKSPRPGYEDIEEENHHVNDDEDDDIEDIEDISLDDLDQQQMPKIDLTKALKNDKDIEGKKEKIAFASETAAVKPKQNAEEMQPPMSARSQLSIGRADSAWSDEEESLFSSADTKKPVLAQLHQKAQEQKAAINVISNNTSSQQPNKGWQDNNVKTEEDKTDEDVWDEDSSALFSTGKDKKGIPLIARPNKEQNNSTVSFLTEEEKRRKKKSAGGEMISDLGLSLSDVSEVSDPELSDIELAETNNVKQQNVPKPTSQRYKAPLSARSGSNWDSSVDDDDLTDKQPTTKQAGSSAWDSDSDLDDIPEIPVINCNDVSTEDKVEVIQIVKPDVNDSGGAQQLSLQEKRGKDQKGEADIFAESVEDELLSLPPAVTRPSSSRSGLITPPSAFQSRESLNRLKSGVVSPVRIQEANLALKNPPISNGLENIAEIEEVAEEDDNWDSESEIITTPRKEEAESEIDKVLAANKPEVIIEEEDIHTQPAESTQPSSNKSGGDKSNEEDDSRWDSESEIMSEVQEESKPLGGTKQTETMLDNNKAPGAASMYDDTDEEDEEEEEESTWEKERREAKQKKAAAALAASHGTKVSAVMEVDEASIQEDRSRKWEEEWEKKQEMLKREAQEELRREQEEENRVNNQPSDEDDDDDIEKVLKPEAILSPVAEESDQPVQAAPTNALAIARQKPPQIEDTSDDDNDIQSRKLRLRREQAERELEAARRKQKSPKPQQKLKKKVKMNVSFDDEDDDTFNDLDVPGMESPRKDGMSKKKSQSEDDGLSYSSTEHDASQHEEHVSPKHTTTLHLSGATSESVTLMRLQEQLRDSQRKLDRERNSRASLENKRSSMEMERSELIQKLEDTTRAKSLLEQMKIDLEAKMRNLQYQFSEETEKRKNIEILYGKARDQLTRKEDQYTVEIEEKQKSELAMRNLQMELRAALSSAKQHEEEKDDLERQLSHERNARQLQEQINEEQLRFTQSVTEDKSESTMDAMNRLETVDENRKQVMDNAEKLKAELYAVKMELERQRSRNKDDHDLLTSENDELHNKIDDLKNDIKLNEDALAQASLNYTMEIGKLKTEYEKLLSSMEKEKAAKDKSETEAESLRTRLEGTVAELEKEQQARSETERKNQKEHEEWSRMIDRRESEIVHTKEFNQSLEQRMKESESKVVRLENELAVASATLVERTNQLATIQKDLDQRRGHQNNIDEALRKEKEDNARLNAKLENLSEQLSTMKHETVTLRTQLDDARVAGVKGDGGAEHFTNLVNSLRADQEKTQGALQEKNSSLSEKVSQLNEQLRNTENRRTTLEQELRHMQADLAEANRKLSVAEASLQVATRSKEQVESDRMRLQSEVDKLQDRLEDTKDKYSESQRRVSELVERADRAEREAFSSSQQYATQASNLQALSMSKSDVEENLRKFEIENARLDAALKHETNKVQQLQKEINDSHQVYLKLQDEMGDMRATNTELKFQMNEVAANKTIASHEAEDAKQLWESEVKSRSKLGLRIAHLERENQESTTQVEEEKRKTRKALELKKTAEGKLAAEIEKNNQLNQEIYTLKSQLKAAKKRLRVVDGPDSSYRTLQANFDQERVEMDKTNMSLKRQLKETQEQLEHDSERLSKLDVESHKLQSEINSLRTMEKNFTHLETAKEILEDELLKVKVKGANLPDNKDMDALRTELEARSKWEVNQTLSQVNKQLDAHALQQERLYKMHENTETQLRKDFEKTKKELLSELTKVRANYEKSLGEKENQERESKRLQDLYDNEVKLRERLMNRLEKANAQAQRAAGIIEHQRYPPIPNVEGGYTVNNTWTLGKQSTNHGVNDLSYKIKQELDRSIAKHLEKGPHIDISVPAHSSYDDSALTMSAFNRTRSDYMQTLQRNYFV